jgi:ubiquinone/menaquinone biosynthesis C-methylase UbiE
MFKGRREIRDAYRDDAVANDYIGERFREPLGALLHARQVAYLREAIDQVKPTSVLELAPGPARLTVEVAPDLPRRSVLVDSSAHMLAVAQARLHDHGHRAFELVQADAFRLPFAWQFDLVYTFRLIRHFEEADRRALYREIARVLCPGGHLVFDAINTAVHSRLPVSDADRRHYDAQLEESELRAELRDCGFDGITLRPVQRRFRLLCQLQVMVAPRSRALARSAMEIIDRFGGGEPLEWVVVCHRA